MKILLTAFDPFGGAAVNPAEEAVRLVRAPAGAELIRLEVPTVFTLAGAAVSDAVRRERPDAVVCVGLAAGRDAVTPERVAINVMDARIPDNAGAQPVDEPVEPGGPAAVFATLPIKEMVRRITEAGLPARVSNTAGTFVCNSLMYTLLRTLEREAPGTPGGFIHVPATPDLAAPGAPSLPLADTVRALEAALSALVTH